MIQFILFHSIEPIVLCVTNVWQNTKEEDSLTEPLNSNVRLIATDIESDVCIRVSPSPVQSSRLACQLE